MSESTVRSQVRFSEKTDSDPLAPLISVADIKTFFGVTDTSLDAKLAMAADIVSGVIRLYTGRTLSKGTYVEVFTDVFEPKVERYLIETPISTYAPANIGALLNKNTGRILLTGGPSMSIEYEGGYDPIPGELAGVYMELVRQQMSVFGVDTIGSAPPASAPPEKAVWVGTLKVEYAVAANSPLSRAAGAGAMTEDALAPYAWILDSYKSHRKLVST